MNGGHDLFKVLYFVWKLVATQFDSSSVERKNEKTK